jgi:subtilase family serine protease
MNSAPRVSYKALASLTSFAACMAFLLPSAPFAAAQSLTARITAPIVNTSRVTLAGSHPAAANAQADLGAIPASTRLQGITLVFSRSAPQQSALDSLMVAQQDPQSPKFHQWITPDQFAAQFGVADSDIAATQAWLQSQGFTLGTVSRSRTRISFSGTEAQVEQAFKTQLHNFRSARAAGGMFFAPATDLSIPAALAGTVLAVENLSSYRPHSHLVRRPQPNLTISGNQAVFLSPPDVATIYDVNPVYSAGFTGTGQTIAIVGQSAIIGSDITAFQTALGVTPKAPNTFLVPNTGVATLYSGDEGESDLDLEYSGAMAPGATINFYYSGNSQTAGVFDAIQYVVDNNSANIISSSYGDCEFDIGQTNIQIIDSILQQGTVQGETILSASGDNGSTDCAADSNLTFAQQTTLGVDYPASSPYITAAGGTEFSAANSTPTNATYWTPAGTSDVVSTAIKYIPEQVWNDDVYNLQNLSPGQSPLSGSGGGASLFETRPTWQTGVAGIASGTTRLLPDISLAASPNFPGYVFCTSDTTYYGTTESGSCVVGFRDATQGYVNAAGGTSFVAPILSGLIAVLNQAKGYTAGQGLINPTLYTLAANSNTYATAFHDITTGSNACLAGTTYCGTGDQTSDFAAGTGYDEATGLGSIDFYNLVTAWPSGGGANTSFSLSASNVNGGTTSTVTATPANGYTGTINFTVSAPSALTYTCYSLPSATISGTSAATSTLTITTNAATCPSGTSPLGQASSSQTFAANHSSRSGKHPITAAGFVLAAVLLLGFGFKRRSLGSLQRMGLSLVLLGLLGFGLSGCSSSATSNVTPPPPSTTTPAGTYTITVVGTSSTNNSLIASTTFTLTVN